MNDVLNYAVYAAVAVLVLGLATWAVNRGGAGKEVDGAVVFRPRPGTVILFAIVAGMGLLLWAASVLALLKGDWQQLLFEFVTGLPFLWLGLFGIVQSVTLREEGILYQRLLLRPLTISWPDLAHYEIAASALASVLVLRPSSPARAIPLSSYAFNLNDLLSRIQQKKALRQQPLRRQAWYRY